MNVGLDITYQWVKDNVNCRRHVPPIIISVCKKITELSEIFTVVFFSQYHIIVYNELFNANSISSNNFLFTIDKSQCYWPKLVIHPEMGGLWVLWKVGLRGSGL